MITIQAQEDLKESILSWMASTITQGEVGTGTTSPTADDTDLESPISGTLKNLTSYEVDSGVITFDYELDETEAVGYTITEFGLFNDDASEMYLRKVFAGQDKTDENVIIIQPMVWVKIEVV